MYLLDYKTPKRLEEPITTLYNRWAQPCKQRPSSTTKARQAVGCFVYNACYWLVRGVEEFDVPLSDKYFSLPLIYNCNKVNRKVSYRHTRKFLDWLVSEDLVTIEVGSVSSWSSDNGLLIPESTSKSVLKLSSEIIGLLLPVASKEPPTALQDVLEVRDAQGNKITKRLGEEQKKLISLIGKYNHSLLNAKVEGGGKRYWVQSKKVFNQSSFEVGGRLYMVGDTDVLDKSVRQGLKIDDQETVELDYCSLHPAIIAEKEGVVWPDSFDPYGVEMEGYDKQCLRSIVKIATLCSLNASNFQSARKALNYHIMRRFPAREWKDKGLVPPVIASTEIMDRVRSHNQYMSSWLYEGKGGHLQYVDSLMMNYIVDAFQQEGRVILPIHDGIILQKGFTEWAKEVMIGAYKHVLGTNYNCRVEEK